MKKFFTDVIKLILLLIFDHAALLPAYFWYKYGGPMGLAVYPPLWTAAAFLNYRFAPNLFSNVLSGISLIFGAWFSCHIGNTLYLTNIRADAETKMVCYAGEELAVMFTVLLFVISLTAFLVKRKTKFSSAISAAMLFLMFISGCLTCIYKHFLWKGMPEFFLLVFFIAAVICLIILSAKIIKKYKKL